MKAGSIIECSIVGYTRAGAGTGQHERWQVELPGAFWGEQLRAEVRHVGRQRHRLYAEPLRWLHALPERREPPCPQQGVCSGCPWMPLPAADQARHKRQLLREVFGIEVDELVQLPEQSLGYRWSCKRVVGGAAGALTFGSYRRGSHELADMRGCLIDHEDLQGCLEELLEVANQVGIEPYDEASRQGELRYLWLKTNGRGQVLLTLVCAVQGPLAEELAKQLQRPHGVFRSIQDSAGNALRGRGPERLAGAEQLAVELADAAVQSGPLGFMQPNPVMAARCYDWLIDELGGEVAYDLYAGLGATSQLLRRRFERVLACDTHVEPQQGSAIEPLSAEQLLDQVLAAERPAPDAVVANPPRAGLGQRVCSQLNELAARRPFALRLMSCDPASFQRDSKWLAAGFQQQQVRAFDTLPQTPHVELVARFWPHQP